MTGVALFYIKINYSTNMHIGKKIREKLDEHGHSASWLAEQIPCERSNVYNIFRRESINVDLLATLSTILEHDFFYDLSEEWKRQRING